MLDNGQKFGWLSGSPHPSRELMDPHSSLTLTKFFPVFPRILNRSALYVSESTFTSTLEMWESMVVSSSASVKSSQIWVGLRFTPKSQEVRFWPNSDSDTGPERKNT